jgi:hypothetical protein
VGFGYPFGFWVSAGLVLVMDGFSPESVFGSGSGFDFGFRFWVHRDSTQSEPDPLPSLEVECEKGTNPPCM